jgi:DNA polymerase (family X)
LIEEQRTATRHLGARRGDGDLDLGGRSPTGEIEAEQGIGATLLLVALERPASRGRQFGAARLTVIRCERALEALDRLGDGALRGAGTATAPEEQEDADRRDPGHLLWFAFSRPLPLTGAPGTHYAGMDNAHIADHLESFASVLELADANPFMARAYRRAADSIRGAAVPVAELVRAGRARELRGIGPGIEGRLRELVETGTIAELAQLERDVAPDLVGLGRYLGLGAQRSVELARALGVRNADELREAAAAGRLQSAPGIGPKTEARLLEALARAPGPRPGHGLLLDRARALVGGVAASLGGEPAGDARRWRDVCELLAVVCPARDRGELVARFAALPQIVAIIEQDERGALGVTVEGVPLQLVLAAPERFGTELMRATGSPRYVDALEPLPDGPDEEAVYRALDLPWCPPELRERPFRGEAPVLLRADEIRGDLHCHTTWSDGRATVVEMARAARERGYEYLAICDHTPAVGVVRGLSPDDVRRQAEEIANANELLTPFRVLRGIECDILPDGRLDLPDDVLAELDWVQASVHAGQRMPARELTKRVEEALRNPHVRCLSHPMGRLIGRRPENALDLERVFEVALEERVALEVNGLAPRLDLRAEHVRTAIQAGVRIVCSTDAHSVRGLGNMTLSVATARRGWATAAEVLNTRPLHALLAPRDG